MTTQSEKIYEQAKNVIPGGVSSPVRAIKPYPFYTASAEGCTIMDADGNRYIDYCMGYGPLILGHAHPAIKDAVTDQLSRGWLYGTPIEAEVRLATKIASIYPSIDMLRFVSSGTEATMSALRAARGYTGRNKFIKIEGGFHGAHDAVLVKAGSGATTQGTPDSLGIPPDFTKHTLQVQYNDIEAMTGMIESNRDDLAAVILEPVLGNIGPILPDQDYLKDVRRVTEENDVLLEDNRWRISDRRFRRQKRDHGTNISFRRSLSGRNVQRKPGLASIRACRAECARIRECACQTECRR